MAARVTKVAHHRNGITGQSFYVANIVDGPLKLLAIRFPGDGFCAVINPALAALGTIEMNLNSWRGDDFIGLVDGAIAAYSEAPRV